jgi:predicted site-specific integrase-resolvase
VAKQVLLTVDAAASKHGIGRRTIFRFIQEGRLNRYRRPADRRTHVDDVELNSLLNTPINTPDKRPGP